MTCSDVNKVQDGIGDKVSNFFQWTSAFVCGIIIGFVYGWKLTLVILAVSPLLVASGGFMTFVSDLDLRSIIIVFISKRHLDGILH